MTTRTEGATQPERPESAGPPGDAGGAPRFDPAAGPILFVRLGAIGDVVRTLPALELLRRIIPGVEVDWLVEEAASVLLRDHPDLRRAIVFRRRALAQAVARLRLVSAGALLRDIVRDLHGAGYAAVVDFQGSLKSALLARATSCPERIGLAPGHGREGSHLLYTHRVDPGDGRITRVERNFRLLRPLGVAPADVDGAKPAAHFPIPDTDRAWARGVLASLAPLDGPRVMLYPGTSRRQAYKRWPLERFGHLAGRLRDDGIQVLVAGGPGEEEMVEAVMAATSTPPARVPDSTLVQLAALLEGVDLFVGGDTGPMHIAWAVGTRVLALFGATDPVINAPYDPLGVGHRVLYRGPETRPYRVKGAPARAWMEAISLDEVHSACREMAATSPARRT